MVTSSVLAGLSKNAPYRELRAAFVDQSHADVVRHVKQWVDAVKADRYPAGRPYRHVNGFTKMVMAEFANGARLTLHYWPADPRRPYDASRPHDHRFPFVSLLLGGSQCFDEFDALDQREHLPADAAAPGEARLWRRFTYSPFLAGRFAWVRHAGDQYLRVRQRQERRPLSGHYETGSDVIHQAITDRTAPCATLVLRGPRERPSSNVFYRPGEPAPRAGVQFGRQLPRATILAQLAVVQDMVSARQF